MTKLRLGMYTDVQPILDAALAAGGGEYTLPDHGKAVHWRHRAYTFRKKFAEANLGFSPYDQLTMSRVPPDSATVVIRLVEPKGVFKAASAAADTSTDKELEAAALAFMNKLKEGS